MVNNKMKSLTLAVVLGGDEAEFGFGVRIFIKVV